jgi:hypothetical protein
MRTAIGGVVGQPETHASTAAAEAAPRTEARQRVAVVVFLDVERDDVGDAHNIGRIAVETAVRAADLTHRYPSGTVHPVQVVDVAGLDQALRGGALQLIPASDA